MRDRQGEIWGGRGREGGEREIERERERARGFRVQVF